MSFLRILDPRGWAALGAVILLLVLSVFIIGRCSRGDEVREASNKAAMGDARTQSAVEAITEIGKLDDRGQATNEEVRSAQDAILNAPAGPVRDRTARYQLCKLHNRPDCDRLLGTRPADPDSGNAPR